MKFKTTRNNAARLTSAAAHIFDNFDDFPADLWKWQNFTPAEMACRGDGVLRIDVESMDKLQALRDMLDKPLYINSAYRSPSYNKRIGGAARSQHMYAKAFDVSMANHDPILFEAAARRCGFTGFGYYPESGFMHIDTGPARSWGEHWPVKNTNGAETVTENCNGNPIDPEKRPAEAGNGETEGEGPKERGNAAPEAAHEAGGVISGALKRFGRWSRGF